MYYSMLTSCLLLMMAFTTSIKLVFCEKCIIPNTPFSCWRMRITAVPAMKPLMVEWEKKSTNIPSLQQQVLEFETWYTWSQTQQPWKSVRRKMSYLKTPKAAWKTPVTKVVVKIKWRYKVGSSFGSTTVCMVWPISNDAAAIVPTAMCLELPKTAYTRGGTKLESDQITTIISNHVKSTYFLKFYIASSSQPNTTLTNRMNYQTHTRGLN